MHRVLSTILFLLICFLATEVRGAERYEFYNGIRQMSMGGAGIAVVNDETSLLINPAGLGKLRDYIITVADPEIELGPKTQSILGTDVSSALDPQKILDKLNDDHLDERYHAKGQLFPSIVVPNFGIGVFAKYVMDAEVVSKTSEYELNYHNDLAGVVAFNFRLFDGRIKLGFNGRFINRVEIDKTLPSSSTDLKLKDLAKEGFGAAADGGLILTAPWTLLPTLSAVVRDIGDTTYTLRDGMFYGTDEDNKPEVSKQTLDAAFALFPILGKRGRMSITGEYRDVLNVYEEKDPMKRVHGGLEWNIGDALFLRGGMNQRYWTAGLEIAVANFQMQAGSYGEEIGTDTEYREDRRYILKFSYRF